MRRIGVRVATLAVVITVGAAVLADPNLRRSAHDAISGDGAGTSSGATGRGFAYLIPPGTHRYPGRWCAGDLTYTVDTTEVSAAGMDPQQELDRWRQVFDTWTEASRGSYRFTYGGTAANPLRPDGTLDFDAVASGTIAITYVSGVSGDEHYASAVAGRTAGNGGMQVTTTGSSDAGALVGDRGFVLIDSLDAGRLAATDLRRALYQHESGHALGLGHVEADVAMMNPTLSDRRLQLSRGDRAGIRALAAMPCLAR